MLAIGVVVLVGFILKIFEILNVQASKRAWGSAQDQVTPTASSEPRHHISEDENDGNEGGNHHQCPSDRSDDSSTRSSQRSTFRSSTFFTVNVGSSEASRPRTGIDTTAHRVTVTTTSFTNQEPGQTQHSSEGYPQQNPASYTVGNQSPKLYRAQRGEHHHRPAEMRRGTDRRGRADIYRVGEPGGRRVSSDESSFEHQSSTTSLNKSSARRPRRSTEELRRASDERSNNRIRDTEHSFEML